MKSMCCVTAVFVALLGMNLLTSGSGSSASAASYPTKALDILTHTPPGGGGDMFSRAMADMITKQKLFPYPVNVINKSGGSGAVAVQYLIEQKKNDSYTVLAYTESIGVTTIRGFTTAKYSDLVPISLMLSDPNVLLVRPDSPYKTLKDLINAAKDKPKQLSSAGTSIGSPTHILTHRLGKAAGVEFNFVSLNSGAETLTAVMGGHLDFTITQPAEAKGMVEAGKLRGLVTFTDQRLGALYKDVPTAKELGYNLPGSSNSRAFMGPPGISKEAIAYLEAMAKKLSESQPFKDYCARADQDPTYMNAAAWGKVYGDFEKEVVPIIAELGLTKK